MNGDANSRWEFHFEPSDFECLTKLVKQRTGIALAPNKRDMVYGRLARRLRSLDMTTFRQYCEFLQSPKGDEEVFAFINALTTNLTRFFREPHHFEHLASTVLARKIKQARTSHERHIRVWSAGSSSGEEPYSVAMTLMNSVPDIARWDARVLATDIDTNMLDKCRSGSYGLQDAETIPEDLYHRFVKPVSDTEVRMAAPVRNLVVFKRLNLMDRWPMKGPFDAIFCRNVAIYFDKPTQKALFERFADLLDGNGFLYVGHAENLLNVTDRFRLIGKTIYQKVR